MSAIREVLKLKGGPSTFNGMGIRRVFCQVMKSGYPANTVSETLFFLMTLVVGLVINRQQQALALVGHTQLILMEIKVKTRYLLN